MLLYYLEYSKSQAHFSNFLEISQNRAAQGEIIDGEKGCFNVFNIGKIELTRPIPRIFSSETHFNTVSTFSTTVYIQYLYALI